jgi:hypothetical protein
MAELDIVAVPVAAVFEDEHQLVLAAIERAHPGIVLDPDAEVFQLAIGVAAGGQQLVDMAPVHADVLQRAVNAECREVAERLTQKGGLSIDNRLSSPLIVFAASYRRAGLIELERG